MDEAFKALLDRLDESKKALPDSIFEKAFDELVKNGVIERLSEERRARIMAEKTAASAKLSAVRAAGRQFIRSETPLPRADGTVARIAEVLPCRGYENCVLMALQSSAEALFSTGITKYRLISFYIGCDEKNEALEAGLETLSALYERVEFIPVGGGKREKERKSGFLRRLFSKK